MTALAIHTHPDGVLAAVMPLGVAAAAGTALVIDLDPGGVRLPGTTSLRDLVARGPSSDQLGPRRAGIACLPNGGVSSDDAAEVVDALIGGWPAVVVRVPTEHAPHGGRGIGVRPILPGLTLPHHFPAVFQPTGLAPHPVDPPGLVLPRLPGRTARALLSGRLVRGRWLHACRELWSQ